MFDVALTRGGFFCCACSCLIIASRQHGIEEARHWLMSHFFVYLVKSMKGDLQLKLHMRSYNGG